MNRADGDLVRQLAAQYARCRIGWGHAEYGALLGKTAHQGSLARARGPTQECLAFRVEALQAGVEGLEIWSGLSSSSNGAYPLMAPQKGRSSSSLAHLQGALGRALPAEFGAGAAYSKSALATSMIFSSSSPSGGVNISARSTQVSIRASTASSPPAQMGLLDAVGCHEGT